MKAKNAVIFSDVRELKSLFAYLQLMDKELLVRVANRAFLLFAGAPSIFKREVTVKHNIIFSCFHMFNNTFFPTFISQF